MSLLIKKEVNKIKLLILLERAKLRCQKGQSTLEYTLVIVIAGIISAILVAVGKPMIVDLISKAFGKISGMI